jgi:hypothetical protein
MDLPLLRRKVTLGQSVLPQDTRSGFALVLAEQDLAIGSIAKLFQQPSGHR